MPTPISTAVPYCPPATMLTYYDWQAIADLLRDGDGPRPTRLAILDPTTTPGAILVSCLMAASGQVESACLVSERYLPADLQALTGSGLAHLERLTARLARWVLAQRRQPGTADPKTVPGAAEALEELDRLRDGGRIFGLMEAEQAGVPEVVLPQPGANVAATLTRQARRAFGSHGQLWPNEGRW